MEPLTKIIICNTEASTNGNIFCFFTIGVFLKEKKNASKIKVTFKGKSLLPFGANQILSLKSSPYFAFRKHAFSNILKIIAQKKKKKKK